MHIFQIGYKRKKKMKQTLYNVHKYMNIKFAVVEGGQRG